MGNSCGCGTKKEEFTAEQMDSLVKIQSASRTYLAKKEKKLLRERQLNALFSNY